MPQIVYLSIGFWLISRCGSKSEIFHNSASGAQPAADLWPAVRFS